MAKTGEKRIEEYVDSHRALNALKRAQKEEPNDTRAARIKLTIQDIRLQERMLNGGQLGKARRIIAEEKFARVMAAEIISIQEEESVASPTEG